MFLFFLLISLFYYSILSLDSISFLTSLQILVINFKKCSTLFSLFPLSSFVLWIWFSWWYISHIFQVSSDTSYLRLSHHDLHEALLFEWKLETSQRGHFAATWVLPWENFYIHGVSVSVVVFSWGNPVLWRRLLWFPVCVGGGRWHTSVWWSPRRRAKAGTGAMAHLSVYGLSLTSDFYLVPPSSPILAGALKAWGWTSGPCGGGERGHSLAVRGGESLEILLFQSFSQFLCFQLDSHHGLKPRGVSKPQSCLGSASLHGLAFHPGHSLLLPFLCWVTEPLCTFLLLTHALGRKRVWTKGSEPQHPGLASSFQEAWFSSHWRSDSIFKFLLAAIRRLGMKTALREAERSIRM